MRVYIAGPVSGTLDYLERFERAGNELWARGFSFLNPAARREREGHRLNTPWGPAIRACLLDLLSCYAYTLLPGWEQSRGAVLEVLVARAIGLEYVPLDVPEEDVEAAVFAIRMRPAPFEVERDELGERYIPESTVRKMTEPG